MANPLQRRGRSALGTAPMLVMILAAATMATQSGQARTFRILHAFKGTPDGNQPVSGLVRDKSGNLYGITSQGGGSCNCGTVFKVDARRHERVLYSFTGGPDGRGPNPSGSLLRDSEGNLYGTTGAGGDLSCNAPDGCGVVFKVDTKGHESVPYAFTGGAAGDSPQTGLTTDTAGNFYGTTSAGGDVSCNAPYGCGVIFTLDTTGKETVLYTFKGAPDAEAPESELLRDQAGNLYGTTPFGGVHQWGTVFKLAQSGGETVLHSFTGTRDGANLYNAGLIRDAEGNLYGVAAGGGKSGPGCESYRGCGLVFKVTRTGKEFVLYYFRGRADGAQPYGTLVRDKAGNLFGTTANGGTHGRGTVFRLTSAGEETVLHNFTGNDGSQPLAGLVLDTTGNLYGTTWNGGPSGDGVVFEITP